MSLVGTRPTGRLHIGHYASVIKPALKYGSDVLVAKYHAPSSDSLGMHRQLDRFGLNHKPQKVDLDTYFKLLEVTPAHLLNAMPQYKAKEKNALMYTYPVLMACDLVGYDMVIVGEDQRPHIEFARDVLPRIGLKCPKVIYSDYKIMDLRHPENKMSKSEPSGCLFLDDEDYERKILKAVTDEAGKQNLVNVFKLLGGRKVPEDNLTLKKSIIRLYKKRFTFYDINFQRET